MAKVKLVVQCTFCNISFSKLLLIANPTFVWGFLKIDEMRIEHKILQCHEYKKQCIFCFTTLNSLKHNLSWKKLVTWLYVL